MPTAPTTILTHSSLSCVRRCRREYWFRYELGLRPAVDSIALNYGRIIHKAIESLAKHGLTDALVEVRREAARLFAANPHLGGTLAATIRAYAAVYEGAPSASIEREVGFDFALAHPATKRVHPYWSLAGKIDGLGVRDGVEFFSEIKTTGEDPTSERYWRRLLIDAQLAMYFIGARALGRDPQYVDYDVVRKPAMRPYQATPAESRKYTKDGCLYANQRAADETPQDWEERLYNDMMERRDFYFVRRPIVRLEHDIEEFRYELWDLAMILADARRYGRWFRSPGRQCDSCAYFDLCTGLKPFQAGDTPEGFIAVEDVHPELHPELNGD